MRYGIMINLTGGQPMYSGPIDTEREAYRMAKSAEDNFAPPPERFIVKLNIRERTAAEAYEASRVEVLRRMRGLTLQRVHVLNIDTEEYVLLEAMLPEGLVHYDPRGFYTLTAKGRDYKEVS